MINSEIQSVGSDILHLGIAYALALPIGWDREREAHSAGLRTFPIVAVAACGFTLLGTALPGASTEVTSRLLQGLITGIGFVGGGAILRDRDGVTGTATAASIWNVGIVGASVGLGIYHIAVVLTLFNLITLKLLTPFKRRIVDLETKPDQDTTSGGS